MHPVHTVICDLGRVIVDFDHRLICARLAACTALSAEAIYAALFSSGLEARFDCGELTGEQFYRHAVSRLGLSIDLPRFRTIWSTIFDLIPATVALLQRVNAPRRLLLSNTNVWHFAYCRAQFPILGLFDATILSYEVGARKPDRAIFERALEHAQAPARACLFIDDMPGHVRAARLAGMQAVQFFSPVALQAELQRRNLLRHETLGTHTTAGISPTNGAGYRACAQRRDNACPNWPERPAKAKPGI